MFTAQLIAALIAAGVATAKAISKGVQAKRQREERQTAQQKHLSAMEQAAGETEEYRKQYKKREVEGLRHQQEQMQPLQDAMMRVYGGTAGYQAPDMSWLMNPQSRPNVDPEARVVKPKTETEPSPPAPWTGAAGRGENKRFGA